MEPIVIISNPKYKSILLNDEARMSFCISHYKLLLETQFKKLLKIYTKYADKIVHKVNVSAL